MSLFQITFKVRHDCPFGNISRKFPFVRMFLWCNRKHEIIEVVLSRESQYEEILRAVGALPGIIEEASDRGNIRLITKRCYCTTKNSIGRNVDANNMLLLMPVSYQAGWEYYRVIAFRHKDFRRLAEKIPELPCELVIIRKSIVDGSIGGSVPVSVDDLFSNLTSRQLDTLLTSYFMGYFSFPRKTNVVEIARAKKVARTTFQEHLTKAENKLVANVVPYLQLLQTA